MKKTQLAILLSFLSCLCGWGQARFVPDAEIVKVGEVEFQVPRRVVFGFTNRGDADLRILEVRPSCGCLRAVFPREPIAPGQHGEVEVTFDAKMLGTFHKDVEIHCEGAEPIFLSMQGCVVREVHDYGAEFPIDLGNVLLETNYLEFDDVSRGDRPCVELRLVNKEKTPFRPELMHLPAYVKAQYVPETIPAGKVGTIRLELDSEALPMLGLNQTSVYLARYLGDKVGDANEIQLSAVLLPDFSQLTDEQKAAAPRLVADKTDVQLSASDKARRTETVTLSNLGKSDLHIRQVQVFSRSLSVSLGNQTLRPGRHTKLKISLHPEHLSSKSRPRVLLITDDPEHPKMIFNVELADSK